MDLQKFISEFCKSVTTTDPIKNANNLLGVEITGIRIND
jgi:hypothetical protein